MKLIHLSDLHLGKRVNEFPMIEDQKHILIKILNIIDEEKPDAVLIAGDVYDRSTPPAEAVQLFDDFLVRLSERTGSDGQQLQTFVVSGNHDSAERLAFGNRLMAGSGIHLASAFTGKAEKFRLVKPANGKDESGARDGADVTGGRNELDGVAEEAVNIYMLPFIKPLNVKAVMRSQGESEESIAAIETYTDAVEKVLADSDIDPKACNVLIAHQYVTGSERSDSEENIGGLDNVDAKAFAGFDYVALGHLHRPQMVSGKKLSETLDPATETEDDPSNEAVIRYCGTPLKYSFSEVRDKKSVTIVELQREWACPCGQENGSEEGAEQQIGQGEVQVRTVKLEPLHDMHEIKGEFDELMQKSFYDGTDYQDAYMRVILTDKDRIPDAIGRLRTVYHNIMTLEYENLSAVGTADIGGSDTVEKTPLEIVEEFYLKTQENEMSEDQKQLAEQLIEEIWQSDK